MNDAKHSALLTVAVLSLLAISIWGGVPSGARWALIAVQLLIVAVQISIRRSGKVRS